MRFQCAQYVPHFEGLFVGFKLENLAFVNNTVISSWITSATGIARTAPTTPVSLPPTISARIVTMGGNPTLFLIIIGTKTAEVLFGITCANARVMAPRNSTIANASVLFVADHPRWLLHLKFIIVSSSCTKQLGPPSLSFEKLGRAV